MTNKQPRRAPEAYERWVPIALGGLVLLIVILVLITIAVLAGVWPG